MGQTGRRQVDCSRFVGQQQQKQARIQKLPLGRGHPLFFLPSFPPPFPSLFLRFPSPSFPSLSLIFSPVSSPLLEVGPLKYS